MSRSSRRFLVFVALFAALSIVMRSSGQTAPPPDSQQPPAGQVSVQDLSIPQLEAAAQQARASGRIAQAVQLLSAIVSRDKDNKEAHEMLGDIYWQAGDAVKAKDEWQAVLKVHPNDFAANFGLGRLKLNSGSYRDVMYYLEIAERVAPPDKLVEVLIPLAQAYSESGELDKARDAIKRAIAKEPDNFQAQYVLTGIASLGARTNEDFDQADTEAQHLIELADKLLRAQGITLEGVQRLYGAYDLRLNVLRGYNNVLFELNADGTRSDRPIEKFKGQLASVVSRVVETRLNQEDTRRTLAYFDIIGFAQKAVELDGGTNKDSLMTLALLQERTGDIAGAIGTFKDLLKVDPTNQTARNALATLHPPAPEAAETPASEPAETPASGPAKTPESETPATSTEPAGEDTPN